MFCFFFFFQAEDGIRDLVRSRGLGDVYKRQLHIDGGVAEEVLRPGADVADLLAAVVVAGQEALHRAGVDAVSYTHLTLPTSDLV